MPTRRRWSRCSARRSSYSFIGGRPPTLGELTEQYRRQVVGRSVDGREEWLNWIVRVDGTAVGYVQATVHEGARAVVAWVIGVPWQGRGYATGAANELVGLLRARGVRRIEAYIVPGHVGSERVAERIGLSPHRAPVRGRADVVGPAGRLTGWIGYWPQPARPSASP